MDTTVTSVADDPRYSSPVCSSWAVQARDLWKIFGSGAAAVHALAGVTLDIQRGQLTAIMGPSGSGKSTLLHLLAGLDTASSGSVYIGHQELGGLNDKQLTILRREHVGFVFQSFNLIPTLNASDNICLPVTLAGRTVDTQWFSYLVGKVGLADRLHHRPSEMSGGQRQRVAIARALITRPTVVFADEPTGNLDSVSSAEVLQLLRDAVSVDGHTVVMVTHDPLAALYADRVVVLADGMIRHDLHAPTLDALMASLATV